MTPEEIYNEYQDYRQGDVGYSFAGYILHVVLPREIAKAKEGYDPDTEPYRCGTCRECSPGGVTDNPFCWSCVEKSRHKEGAD